MDYQHHLLSDYDVYFLATSLDAWQPLGLFHQDQLLSNAITLEQISAHNFEFALFVGFKENELTRQLLGSIPSFCLTDTYPREDLPDTFFRGIMTHRSTSLRKDILILGACYNSDIFFKNRRPEEFVLCVARIHPDKNQLELVRGYKERIFGKYGLPLWLVGGVGDLDYFMQVRKYIDQVSVFSTIDPETPLDHTAWKRPEQIADLSNRARAFVMASPRESFCIALIEAMACGTTCVIDGNYPGFDESDIGPNVYGNSTGKRGLILDCLDEALSRDIRLDGSGWAKKFSLKETRKPLLTFISERL